MYRIWMKIFVTEKIVAECKIMFMLSGKLLNVNGYIREQINVNEFEISEFCTISPIIVEWPRAAGYYWFICGEIAQFRVRYDRWIKEVKTHFLQA